MGFADSREEEQRNDIKVFAMISSQMKTRASSPLKWEYRINNTMAFDWFSLAGKRVNCMAEIETFALMNIFILKMFISHKWKYCNIFQECTLWFDSMEFNFLSIMWNLIHFPEVVQLHLLSSPCNVQVGGNGWCVQCIESAKFMIELKIEWFVWKRLAKWHSQCQLSIIFRNVHNIHASISNNNTWNVIEEIEYTPFDKLQYICMVGHGRRCLPRSFT